VLKAHGSAKERAIASAIGVMARNLQHQVSQSIATEIAAANERLAPYDSDALALASN
jgi:fatty acid/phospholipid biosynthesis enzyme